jgi:hypothetical protein
MRNRLLACIFSLSCLVALGGLFSTSCAKGSTGSTPGAPASPITTIPASATTQSELGIASWKLDLGPQGLLVTGYDAGGAAVHGLLLAFTQAQLPSQMMIQVQDGTERAQIFSLNADGTVDVMGTFTRTEGELVGQVFADIIDFESRQGHGPAAATLDVGASDGIRAQDVLGGLHPLNQPGPNCDQQYGSDLYNIGVGGVVCAIRSPVRGIGWALGVFGAKGVAKLAGVPGCVQAAQSFFALGNRCSNSCFQNSDACPSCGSGTHLSIDSSTGVGSCADGDPATPGGCPAGSKWIQGPNNKGHTCCLVCNGNDGVGTGGSVRPASLSVLDDTDTTGSCPELDDGGMEDGSSDGGGDGGSEGGGDGGQSDGSDDGGGSDGGGGDEAGYATMEVRRPLGRHHVFMLAEGASDAVGFTWNDVAGVAAPADLWVEAQGRTVLQIASVGRQPFARAGLDVVALMSGEPYHLSLERTRDSLRVGLRSKDDRSLLEIPVPVRLPEGVAEAPAIDVVLPSRPMRQSIASDLR